MINLGSGAGVSDCVLRSRRTARRIWSCVVTLLLTLVATTVAAQGVSTAGIRGVVVSDTRQPVDARIRVSHDLTGASIDVRAANGRFLVEGLEPGGPYTVVARALGFVPHRERGVVLTLGELRQLDVVLPPVARQLDTMTIMVDSSVAATRAHTDGGIGVTIPDSWLEHLPTLNRSVYDFMRLVPQISTKIGLPNTGLSAAGMGFRFNNFLINGVSERSLSGGVSNAFAGSKSVPIDAVKEYEVLLSPYDVRYGDFAGALVNTITKSGTNTFRGSLFAYGRTDQLQRRGRTATLAPYERLQYGFSLGGPIVPDRLHFFVALELQHFTYPAAGPYVGQPTNADRPVPVSASDLSRFDEIMRGYGLTAGSAGPIENGNPLRNLFTRFDLALPAWNTRVLLWNNYSRSDNITFSRAALDTFSLSSYQVTGAGQQRATALQLHTALTRAGGGHNELLLSRRSDGPNAAISAVRQSIVRVSVPSTSGGRVTLNTGTHEIAQGALAFVASEVAVKDNLTIPLRGRHVATVGAEAERFRIRRGSPGGSYGSWTFASLDDLQLGVADRYEVRIDFGTSDAELRGGQYSAYAGDRWQVSDGLSLTAGLRGDLLALDGHAPYQRALDSIFGRRTDQVPRRRVELSPRAGFVWDPSGSGRDHLRGGIGMFAGRYPLAWPHSALINYGVGGVLRCSRLGTPARYPPAFDPDYRTPPTACGGGATITPSSPGDVDLVDRNLRMVRVARGSIAYERRLAAALTLTNELLVTRALSDVVFLNLNLPEPVATDSYGRVMYGTIGPPALARFTPRPPFAEVIDVRSAGGNRSYQLSTRLETWRGARTSAFVSYTYSRARDVQTPLRVQTRGTVAWASARVMAGRHDDLRTSTSSNDVPHRAVLAATYAAPWRRARSELSFYYVGESGRPFTYVAYGALGRGDLNADGSSANDPVYIPRNALDTAEIRFSGFSDSLGADNSAAAQAAREAAQRAAFGDFIGRMPCVRHQRGRIMERNSCSEPWSNTTIASLRQVLPARGRSVELQIDVFNVLNFLNRDWGLRREAVPALLEHVGQTDEPVQTARPIFRFDTTAPRSTTLGTESAFQLQLAVRYRF